MARISVFHEENASTYLVNADLRNGLLSDSSTMGSETYLTISTNMRQSDNSVFPSYIVRDLTDTPPSYGSASDFTGLINFYIEYFVDQAELGQSSSSSSSSTSSSSSSSTSESSSSSSSSSSTSESSSSSSSSSSTSESSSSSSSSSTSESSSSSSSSSSTSESSSSSSSSQ